jgi:hypothetical protein
MENLTEKVFVPMVERYAAIWHGGKIPADRISFVAAILDSYLPESERQLSGVFSVEAWLAHRDECAAMLAEACDCVARHQAARWEN